MNVSVIIPIFGVEKFIQRCAESLMKQTLESVEFIFVDDCSCDNSIVILEEILSNYSERRALIIHHEQNKGLPAARNTGLKYATGDYVIHCDSDDYLETNALELLYAEAVKRDADIVWCDFYEDYEDHMRYIHQPSISGTEDAIKAMLSNEMRFNVWNKLCRRSLYTTFQVQFLEGNSMGEDMSIIKLFVNAHSLGYVPNALYHYIRNNPTALTNNYTTKHIKEDKNNISSLSEYLASYSGDKYYDYIGYHTLWTKLPLLLTSGNNGQYIEWGNWDPIYDNLIPTLPNAGIRLKWLMMIASRKNWFLVRLHYILVIKLYYSIRYRNR